MLLIFLSLTILSSTIGTGKINILNNVTPKVGVQITLSLKATTTKTLQFIKVIGGIEGEPHLYSKVLKRWNKGKDRFFNFNWTPTSAGDYVAYFTFDPENAKGLKKKVTLNIKVTNGKKKPPPKPGTKEPDIKIEITNYTPSPLVEGKKCTFSLKAINNGTAGTGKIVNIALYEDSKKVCSKDTPAPLAPGGFHNVQCEFTPSSAGTHAYKAFIDESNQIPESNESNNHHQLSLVVQQKSGGQSGNQQLPKNQLPTIEQYTIDTKTSFIDEKPDLIVLPKKIHFQPNKPEENTPYKAYVSIKNTGGTIFKSYAIGVSLYIDNILQDEKSVNGLAKNEEKEVIFNLPVKPNSSTIGKHMARFVVDRKNKFHEKNESNNHYQVGFEIVPIPKPASAKLTYWYIQKDKKQVTEFDSRDEKVNLIMQIVNKGDAEFNGEVEYYGFVNNARAQGGYDRIRKNVPVNYKFKLPPGTEKAFNVATVEVGHFLQPGHVDQKVFLAFRIYPGSRGITKPKDFKLNMPDLTVVPRKYKITCSGWGNDNQGKATVYGSVESMKIPVPKGKNFRLRYSYPKWNSKKHAMDRVTKYIDFKGPVFNEQFTAEVEGFEYTSKKGSFTQVCFYVDVDDKVEETNEMNNKECVKVVFSRFEKHCVATEADQYF